MKKILEDDESSVEVSVHQQPLVTKSCYHQDRDLNKRQNTAAKLRPKTEARILQLTAEVVLTSRLNSDEWAQCTQYLYQQNSFPSEEIKLVFKSNLLMVTVLHVSQGSLNL